MSLNNIRRQIDDIDKQVAAFLKMRMDLSLEVARTKSKTNKKVKDGVREQKVLENVEKIATPYDTEISAIYNVVMSASRNLQHIADKTDCDVKKAIDNAIFQDVSLQKGDIVCQGEQGSFSHEAAQMIFPDNKPRFVRTFSDVFEKVSANDETFGIVPIQNSYSGSVHETYNLIEAYNLYVVADVDVPVNHNLLALPGSKIEDIKAVISHPQALAQCADVIEKLLLEARPHINTALAAKEVSQKGEKTVAAIASSKAAELYNLDVLQESIQNAQDNFTRFVVISKKLYVNKSSDTICLKLKLPHETGALYQLLSQFASLSINITKLESRPQPASKEEFLFFIDIKADIKKEEIKNLLCQLEKQFSGFTFLGVC